MASFEISVQVLERFDGLVSEDWLIQIAVSALEVGLARPDVRMSVVIADDEVVRDLNKKHRGLDERTDVLSFSFAHWGEYYGEGPRLSEPGDDLTFVLPPEERSSLGEVVISYPQAQRQAMEAGRPLEKELAVLLAHGVLHLLGHDHMEPDEEAAMNSLQSEAVARGWGKA